MFVFEKFKEMSLNDNIGYQRQKSARTGTKEKKTGGRKGVSEK